MPDYDEREVIANIVEWIDKPDTTIDDAIDLFYKADGDAKMAVLVALSQYRSSRAQQVVQNALQNSDFRNQLERFVSDIPGVEMVRESHGPSSPSPSRARRSVAKQQPSLLDILLQLPAWVWIIIVAIVIIGYLLGWFG